MILKNNTKRSINYRICCVFSNNIGNGLCVREHNRETNRDTFITCEDKEFSERQNNHKISFKW